MNQLNQADRARVIACLCEGNSLRSTVRLTGIHRTTIQKLLVEIGRACSAYQDKTLRGLTCKRLQCDELWSFVGCKEKNATAEKKAKGQGDCWTWTAIDPDTKLIAAWFVGTRDGGAAYHFMHDLAGRLANRVQLTTDGHKAYLTAVEDAFGTEIDYAMLNKIYGPSAEASQHRYSPAQCMGAKKAVITGTPDFGHVSTSIAERANLTIRMSNRRYTRLTNAFSKKIENHEAAAALFFMHYNFCKIHGSLRVTPAMAAGVSSKVWEVSDIIALLDETGEKAA
jgi:IS1 family transposase